MKRKHRRLLVVGVGMAVLGAAAALVLLAFDENLVFFFSPSDFETRTFQSDQRLRVGGLVEEGSVVKSADGLSVQFNVTDLTATVPVRYQGILPDLFREGQGVIAEGHMRADGVFEAAEVLAKHDENYMPREVADALKEAGEWRGGEAAAETGAEAQ